MNRLILLPLLFCFIYPNNPDKILTLNEPLNDISYLKVNIDYSLGNLVMEAGQPGMAVTGYLKYNHQHIDGRLEYNEYGSTGILNLETDIEVDWNFKFDEDDKNKIYNESELYLSSKMPTIMNIDVGMGKSTLSLDRLMIEDFNLDCGMCETNIDFGEVLNPVKCASVDIDAGLGSAKVRNILNSNSDKMEFECGLGSMDLHFGGELKRDIEVDLSIGLGTMEIEIPIGTNVIFEYDGSFLASVDLVGFTQINDEYHSKNFDNNNPVIYITGSIGGGSLEINWIGR
ncbi:MAG: hypothetical protein ACE5D7_07610 [Fidelibacterota bacterium]